MCKSQKQSPKGEFRGIQPSLESSVEYRLVNNRTTAVVVVSVFFAI